jgi:hypothetical protein
MAHVIVIPATANQPNQPAHAIVRMTVHVHVTAPATKMPVSVMQQNAAR